jgi:small subunit ribosomal protein S9
MWQYNITATVVAAARTSRSQARNLTGNPLNRQDLRLKLKKEGFLTRDPRETERKKYGKGRKKEIPFSKR